MDPDKSKGANAMRKTGPLDVFAAPLSRRAFARGAASLGLGLGAAGALGGAAGLGCSAKAAGFKADRSFKIGFIAPLTGPVAPEGIAMQRGFDLALEELNASGGVAGRPVEVVRQDDQAVPAVAGTVMKKFIQQDQVDLVVGTITSDEETVASQIAAAYGVPVIFPEAGFWMPFCKSPAILLGETSYSLLGPLVPFMAEKYGKKFLLIGSDFEFPHQYLGVGKGFIAKVGGTVVDELYAPLGTADWSSSIAKIKAAAPDVSPPWSAGTRSPSSNKPRALACCPARISPASPCSRSSTPRWATPWTVSIRSRNTARRSRRRATRRSSLRTRRNTETARFRSSA
jgi:hypothetical protein